MTTFAPGLIFASTLIIFLLGTAHLVLTFRGQLLHPHDAELEAQMRIASPNLTRETTMWKAWVGFNASHSFGALLFSLIYGYLALTQTIWHDASAAVAYNFGPHTHEAASVGDVIALARTAYGRGESQTAPQAGGPHEAGWLALEIANARDRLGFVPRWPLAEAVQRTMVWYRHQAEGADARALCEGDIDAYEVAA